jgi:anti-sigma regulatory factor (Ser/Thr protein kinase)
MPETLVIPVTDASNIAQARRLADGLAGRLGFNEIERGRVALVVTEMTSNLVKHVRQGGELLLHPVEANGITGLELLSLDKGPGMVSPANALRDGYSTAGTPGAGLGAIHRLAALFDIHSAPGLGTAVLAQLWAGPSAGGDQANSLHFGAVRVALPGQEVCGDNWSARQRPNLVQILVADGLGHGWGAAQASREAIKIFHHSSWTAPQYLLEKVHAGMRHTRGAAVAVVQIDVAGQEVRFAGIGNITATILSPDSSHHLISHNGTAGYLAPKIQEFAYAWAPQTLLVLHSDGLTNRWSLEPYTALAERHPSLIAGVLYRDFKRGKDDVVVVVARQ